MSAGPPSLTASQQAATDCYTLRSAFSGTPPAASEDVPSVVNSAEHLAASSCITEPKDEVSTSDMEQSHDNNGDWIEVTRKKRKKHGSSSSKSSVTVITPQPGSDGLTVIFVSAVANQLITTLSSLKLSLALEQLCPECIHEIRPNTRLNLIAVDTRNGETTRKLLACTELCGLKVRAYQPVPRHYAVGVIRDVDISLSEAEIEQNVRSPEGRVIRQRRLGQSTAVKLSFSATTLPSFVYLGHVRHPVSLFKERPIQCTQCWGYGHRVASCKRPHICGRCGDAHSNGAACSAQEKCINCGQAHAATSPSCPKWKKEKETRDYVRKHAVEFRVAKSALHLPQRMPRQKPQQPPPTPQKGTNESVLELNPGTSSSTQEVLCQGTTLKMAPQSTTRRTYTAKSAGSTTSGPALEEPAPSTSDALPRVQASWECWIPFLRMVTRMACTLLSSVDTQWARSILSLLDMVLPLMESC